MTNVIKWGMGLLVCTWQTGLYAQTIISAGKPAQLDIRTAGLHGLRVTLKPLDYAKDLPENPAVDDTEAKKERVVLQAKTLRGTLKKKAGNLQVQVTADPLRVTVLNGAGQEIQQLTFEPDGKVSFLLGNGPVLGMGEGGPKPTRGTNWRTSPIQFDRRGFFDTMEPRWQSDAYGSRNPAAMLWGTGGWGLFVAIPWVQVDMASDPEIGYFIPWKPAVANVVQNERNQQEQNGKGIHPLNELVPGLYDVFVFDTREPTEALHDFSLITGKAAMPPKWALGYMQSHRTLRDDAQMVGIVDTFRTKKIPLDAVIYLGTGFTPKGWNTRQPSFDFNPEVFKKGPETFFEHMKHQNTKVVLHMVPWDRDKLPTLHGNIPPEPDEVIDSGHILTYWKQHEPLVKMGVAAFWPDEGDWFNLYERIKRHQLYYQGYLSTLPNVRPWSLQRNGFPGIAKWGGWVWSGDTESSWKTLEGQIAVGINYSLSIGPYWGSDIGGFYANAERTGELYARWYQFGAFCGSFRSHGRNWHLALPWGWGLSDMGVREDNNSNSASRDPARGVQASEMNNPAIEPVVKKYDELRYKLLPYTYTLAWQAREEGLPLMRALWLHYPQDAKAVATGDQYLWGRDLLIAPVFEKGATHRNLYLPEGDWYDWWTNKKEEGKRNVAREVDLGTMPIYVRAGAIIPLDPVRQYAMEVVKEPTTFNVYSGHDGSFTLYEDDGISQEYLMGAQTLTKLAWDDRSKKLTISPASANVSEKRTFKIALLPEGTVKEVTYSGKPISVNFN